MNTDSLTAEELKKEIEKIAVYINQAKLEIASISLTEDKTGSNKNIAAAAMELNEVVRHTEEATNLIMDNAEAIMGLASAIGSDGIKINEHSLSILEACSFQDITGQRIGKVLKTLEQIELRIGNLINLFGGQLPTGFKVGEIETSPRRPDEDLMEGPQLAAANQDEIDRLFNAS